MSVELRTTTYAPSPPPPSSTQVQQGCLSTEPLPRSTSWRLAPCQTQYQFTTLMELQTRMDPSWRKLRSYSGMANTWRKHTSQLPTSDGRPSSLGIHGLPITIQKLTGLARVSCLDALLSVEGSQMEVWQRMTDQNPGMQFMPHSFPLSGQCRQDNNLPHESFVESSSRARMSYHNCPKSHLYSIM